MRAKKGGEQTGPNPTDRGKAGSKYQLVADRNGLPLAVRLSAANAHDSLLFEPLIDDIPAVLGPRGRPGRPRCRPAKLHADKAYDIPRCRRYLRRRGITARIARKGIESSERLGRYRSGWSSGRWPGSASTAGWRSAMSEGMTSTWRSCT